MSVWLCIPSARPDGGTLREWHEKGYSIAVWRDPGSPSLPFLIGVPHYLIVMPYPGYAKAVNWLVNEAMVCDPYCEWFVTGGDDTSPDMAHSPEEIAAKCTEHFNGTFGVCQPTGDRWRDAQGVIIERIAGSPWFGRDYCRRMYGGKGPLWEGWWHNWEDEEAKCVAEKLGVYWMNPEWIHYHNHPLRVPGGKRPDFHRGVDSDYTRMKPVFIERKRIGFPGHEPIA